MLHHMQNLCVVEFTLHAIVNMLCSKVIFPLEKTY
jgi:hypothetical protein